MGCVSSKKQYAQKLSNDIDDKSTKQKEPSPIHSLSDQRNNNQQAQPYQRVLVNQVFPTDEIYQKENAMTIQINHMKKCKIRLSHSIEVVEEEFSQQKPDGESIKIQKIVPKIRPQSKSTLRDQTYFPIFWNMNTPFAHMYKIKDSIILRISTCDNRFYQLISQNQLQKIGKYTITLTILKYTEKICFGITSSANKYKPYSGDFSHDKSIGYWSEINGLGCLYVNGKSAIEWNENVGVLNSCEVEMILNFEQNTITFVRKPDQIRDRTWQHQVKLDDTLMNEKLHLFISLLHPEDSVII